MARASATSLARRSSGAVVARSVKLLERRYGVPRRRPSRQPLIELIATILSQNTSDSNSGLAWRRLRRAFPTMRALAAASEDEIEFQIRPGGLSRTKSRRIAALLRLLPKHGGAPSLAGLDRLGDREAMNRLLAIEGVGLKTAACVMLFALGRDVCPVDTHVERIARRVPLALGARSAGEVFRLLGPLIPAGKALLLHINLIRLGRELCRPRRPRCGDCPLRRLCDFGRKRGRAKL